MDHLEELRWHLIRSIGAVVVLTVLAFINKTLVFDIIALGPTRDDFPTYSSFCALSHWLGLGDRMCIGPVSFEKIETVLGGQFLSHIKVSLIVGFVAAFPYVFWEFWRFIRPGLYEHEARYTRGIVFFSSVLFFLGVGFGYFVLAPFSVNFFAGYTVSDQIINKITLGSYLSVVSTIVMASGIMFELPMVVYFLAKLGIVSPAFMREYRKHAFVTILVIAAVITPADIWTQVFVTIPVYVLYELSIYICAYVYREAAEKEASLKLEEPKV